MTASQYKYLDCIDSLCKQNENFNMASIAAKLGVSRVSSYRAMEKLRANRLIDTTKEGKWFLTEKGKEKLEEVRNGIRFLQEVLENTCGINSKISYREASNAYCSMSENAKLIIRLKSVEKNQL